MIKRETKPQLPEAIVAKLRPLANSIIADYTANTKARDAFLTATSKTKYAVMCNKPTSKGSLSSYLANRAELVGAVIGMVIVGLKANLASTGTVLEVEEFDFSEVEA